MGLRPSDPESKVMYFGQASFIEGVNVTIRRGAKWAHLGRGDMLLARSSFPEETWEKEIRIKDTRAFRFKDVPLSILRLEHDPKCADPVVLLEAMHTAYDDFNENEIVTIVFFVVIGHGEGG